MLRSFCNGIFHFLLLCYLVININACGYNPSNMKTQSVHLKHVWKRRRSSNESTPVWRPIQIETKYDDETITNNPAFDDRDRKDINKFTIRAVKFYKKTLQVRQIMATKDPITINDCGPFKNKSEKYGDNDFYLYVHADANCQEGTLATAGSCGTEQMAISTTTAKIYHMDDEKIKDCLTGSNSLLANNRLNLIYWSGRPIAGQLRICTQEFKKRVKRTDDDKWISTFMHEMAHALVFSGSLYKQFYNAENENDLKLYDRGQLNFNRPQQDKCVEDDCSYEIPGVVKKVTRNWKHQTGSSKRDIYMLITPKAKMQAIKYFNCPKLEGVELEGQGDSGSAFSHLEKRIFEHETMSAIRTQYNSFSVITLGIMEDSGWYRVNYREAEPMTYGQGKGCDFVQKSCKQYVDENEEDPYPFCSKRAEQRCSSDKTAIEMCNIDTIDKSVPEMFRYFESENGKEGGFEFADYCSYYTVYNRASRETKCNVATTSAFDDKDANARRTRKGQLNIYSKTSRCFNLAKNLKITTIEKDQPVTRTTSGPLHGCYEHKCENGSLWIKTAKSKFYRCYHTNQLIHVNKRLTDEKATSEFQIECPPCADYCTEDNFHCNDLKKDVPKRVGDPEKKQHSIFGDGSSGLFYALSAALTLLFNAMLL